MKIYEFELTYPTVQGIESDTIFTIKEYSAIEKENYYQVEETNDLNSFRILKDEINQLHNGCMWCLTNLPSFFIKAYIQQTKDNIDFHNKYLNKLKNTLSILENLKGE